MAQWGRNSKSARWNDEVKGSCLEGGMPTSDEKQKKDVWKSTKMKRERLKDVCIKAK